MRMVGCKITSSPTNFSKVWHTYSTDDSSGDLSLLTCLPRVSLSLGNIDHELHEPKYHTQYLQKFQLGLLLIPINEIENFHQVRYSQEKHG